MPEVADDPHFRFVVEQMLAGKVIPFLGAGANMCDRPPTWEPKKTLPVGGELAQHLADELGYPREESVDLLLVSQWGALKFGSAGLYDKLHELFAGEWLASRLHTFLAELPAVQRRLVPNPQYSLIVTTNYDDALERAFEAAGEQFDVVWYEAKEDDPWVGSFFHRAPDGAERAITEPAADMVVSRDENPVVLKIHGGVNRVDPRRDSFVITESNYIDYLSRTGIDDFPASIKLVMSNAYFLFLGYSLADWNLRALLHRIWEKQGALKYASWAVQWRERPSRLDELFWNKRNVWIYNLHLGDYVDGLRKALDAAVADADAAA